MKQMSFEAAMQQLEQIVDRLENGEESLDSSLKLYEEGSVLAAFCYKKLQSAEQKITELSKLENVKEEGAERDD